MIYTQKFYKVKFKSSNNYNYTNCTIWFDDHYIHLYTYVAKNAHFKDFTTLDASPNNHEFMILFTNPTKSQIYNDLSERHFRPWYTRKIHEGYSG